MLKKQVCHTCQIYFSARFERQEFIDLCVYCLVGAAEEDAELMALLSEQQSKLHGDDHIEVCI
jgi:hypothetical protein